MLYAILCYLAPLLLLLLHVCLCYCDHHSFGSINGSLLHVHIAFGLNVLLRAGEGQLDHAGDGVELSERSLLGGDVGERNAGDVEELRLDRNGVEEVFTLRLDEADVEREVVGEPLLGDLKADGVEPLVGVGSVDRRDAVGQRRLADSLINLVGGSILKLELDVDANGAVGGTGNLLFDILKGLQSVERLSLLPVGLTATVTNSEVQVGLLLGLVVIGDAGVEVIHLLELLGDLGEEGVRAGAGPLGRTLGANRELASLDLVVHKDVVLGLGDVADQGLGNGGIVELLEGLVVAVGHGLVVARTGRTTGGVKKPDVDESSVADGGGNPGLELVVDAWA